MENSFFNMIYLFSCGMKGEMPEITSDFDFYKIRKDALKHGAWLTVFLAIKKLYDASSIMIEKSDFEKWQNEFNLSVIKYAYKQEHAYKFLNKIENKNIEYVVLKGDVLSDLYFEPSARISTDIDILTDPKNEKKIFKLFTEENGVCRKRTEDNNQSVCIHPKAGVFEVHVSLDIKEIDEIWYQNKKLKFEPFRTLQLRNGNIIKTLSITDGAIHIFLHFIKHVIQGIAHIRMLGDTLIYLNQYSDKIDFKLFDSIINELGYNKIYEVLKYIGVTYFRFENLQGSDKYSELANDLLIDVYNSGNSGFDEEIYNVFREYSKARYEKHQGTNYYKHIRKFSIKRKFEILFPNRYYLIEEYPILLKSGKYLVFVWIFRLVKKALGFRRTGTNLNKSKTDRFELIKKLDMI